MARIQLTIDPEYCSSWGFWEGVREVIQNAKDADEYNGCAMTVSHSPRTSKLTVSTTGISLEPKLLLLLGASSKRSGDQRGKFGEGFALGMLALVRAGHPVTIYNGDEVWRPVVEKADDGPFAGEDLLVFQTRKLQQRRDDFSVEVENVSKEVWEATRKLFLFLAPPGESDQVTLRAGAVLLDEARKGQIFARGIFVNNVEDLDAGYDLHGLQLDRDRRMVDEWDLRGKLAELWNEAHAAEPEKFAVRLYEMAKRGAPETKSMSWRADQKLLKSLHQQFEKEHGEGAVPVADMSESKELNQLGGKGVVVDKTLKELLEKTAPSSLVVKEKLKGAVRARYAWEDLNVDEAAACSSFVEPITKDYVIVDFNDENVMARAEDGKVSVAKALLQLSPREITKSVIRAEAARSSRDVETVFLDTMFAVKQ